MHLIASDIMYFMKLEDTFFSRSPHLIIRVPEPDEGLIYNDVLQRYTRR